MAVIYGDLMARDGYCVVPGVFPAELIDRLRALASAVMTLDPAGYAISKPMSIGYWQPEVHEAIHWPAMHAALGAMGIADLRYYSAVLLNARPGEGPGGWHHDWWGWDQQETAWEICPELACFIYLVDTCGENGCLKVVPGTHRRRDPWCDKLREVATAEHPDQIDVPVKSGDMVVCDARVIHGRHGNQTDADRPLVTLWFLRDFGRLSPAVRAYVSGAVSQGAKDDLGPLMPECKAGIEPLIPNYQRPK